MPDMIENNISNIKQAIREKSHIKRKLQVVNAENSQIKRYRRAALFEKKIAIEDERTEILEAAADKAQAEEAFDAAISLEQSESEVSGKAESDDKSDNLSELQAKMAERNMLENLFKPMTANSYKISNDGLVTLSQEEQERREDYAALKSRLIENGDTEGVKKLDEAFGEANKEYDETLSKLVQKEKAEIVAMIDRGEINCDDYLRSMPEVNQDSFNNKSGKYLKDKREYTYQAVARKKVAQLKAAGNFEEAAIVKAKALARQERVERLIKEAEEADRQVAIENSNKRSRGMRVVGTRADELSKSARRPAPGAIPLRRSLKVNSFNDSYAAFEIQVPTTDLLAFEYVEGVRKPHEAHDERNKGIDETLSNLVLESKAKIVAMIDKGEINCDDYLRNMPKVDENSFNMVAGKAIKSDSEYTYQAVARKKITELKSAGDFEGAERVKAAALARKESIGRLAETSKENLIESSRIRRGFGSNLRAREGSSLSRQLNLVVDRKAAFPTTTPTVEKSMKFIKRSRIRRTFGSNLRAREGYSLSRQLNLVVDRKATFPTTTPTVEKRMKFIRSSRIRRTFGSNLRAREGASLSRQLNKSVDNNSAFPTQTPTKVAAVHRQVVGQQLTAARANVGAR